MSNQAATARLALDASGFDKQANASFREFSKQLTSVKDATDVAMRGAEALQKVFVKSLGGTIAIGAASALGDAMRDIGNRIGSAADAAARAGAGITGFSGSLEEAAARAQSLSSASAEVGKALNELANANPIQKGIFNLFGGEEVLKQLEETTKGLAGMELLTGLQQGNRSARRLQAAGPDGQEAEQQRMADEKARRDLQSSAAFRGADPATQGKIMQAFEEKIALAQAARDADRARKYDAETQKLKTDRLKKLADMQQQFTEQMLDRDLADARRARESERESADLLAKAQADLAGLLQERVKKEQGTSTGSPAASSGSAQQLSGDLLGSSRSGQQAMGAAEKSRGVQVSRENFQFQNRVFEDMATAESNRTGLGFTKQDMRKRVAAEEAARANPSMLDKAQAAGLGMDASDYAGQKARFKSSLGNAAGFSSQEIDSQFRNKLQKDAAQQKQGAAQGGGMEKLLQDVLNKLTSAPVITV